MAIFLRQSYNVKPPIWGSPADRQYAIWRNLEDIYRCDHESEVLIMPGFWGLPLLDYSGYNNNGTNHGATYKDGSLSFGGNDYVNCGNNTYGWANAFTISAWIKHPDSIGDDRAIIGIDDENRVLQFRIDNDPGLLQLIRFDSNNQYIGSALSTGIVDDNQWHHVLGTFSTTNGAFLYIDGVQDGSLASTTANNDGGTPTYIGSRGVSNDFFNGLMLEVKLAKATRTANQITLFCDRPWDLYRPVSRPFYSIPAVPTFVPQIIMF